MAILQDLADMTDKQATAWKKKVDAAKDLAEYYRTVKNPLIITNALATLADEVKRLEVIVEADWIERVCSEE